MKITGFSKILNAHRKSSSYRALRLQRLTLDNHRCRNCGTTERLEVHHWLSGYDRIAQGLLETMDDLATLCLVCHHDMTNRMRGRNHAQHTYTASAYQRIVPIVETSNLVQPFVLADIQRTSPLPPERITRHGASLPVVPNHRRSTPDRS